MPASIDPILLDIPDHFETERLLMRIPRPGDGVMIHEGIVESHAELRAWMPWAYTLQSAEETEQFARRNASNFILRHDMIFLLLDKESGEFLGNTGLHPHNWNLPYFEIGYWLRTSKTGHGYMTEAVKGLTQFAFDELNAERLEIRCDAENERSATVAERAGYRLEAYLKRHDRKPDGEIRDTLIFARVRVDNSGI